MEQEIKVQDVELENADTNTDMVFDLVEDKAALEAELSSSSMYFNLESGVTYKVRLKSTKVRRVEKTFGDDKVTKYEMAILAKGSDKSEFDGLWEVGTSVLKPIFKDYEEGAVFNIARHGTGKDTRYSVNKDF